MVGKGKFSCQTVSKVDKTIVVSHLKEITQKNKNKSKNGFFIFMTKLYIRSTFNSRDLKQTAGSDYNAPQVRTTLTLFYELPLIEKMLAGITVTRSDLYA